MLVIYTTLTTLFVPLAENVTEAELVESVTPVEPVASVDPVDPVGPVISEVEPTKAST